ncbi:MAG TPA: hypothetical protein VEH02_10595 [Pseudolabrys sp.]|nr:hypothetical protein [Pseudolabrys sp.]
MNLTHKRLVLASVGLPWMILASTLTCADDNASGATPVTPPAEIAPAPATADQQKTAEQTPSDQKPGRLRFRAAGGACTCECAKGGMSEADIQRAGRSEGARDSAKN